MPAVTPQGNFEYILEADKGEDANIDFITTFKCRKLSSVELSRASDLLYRQQLHDYMRYVLTHGLRGWDNYKTVEGNDIPFETSNLKHPSNKTLDSIPYDHLVELVRAITERSQSSNEDKGK
jgi:hypothetical protein